jgi:alkanesulfonate monooxygenase SsuD/methylene tetrahydromethanopterin reductase-like flavin-dependent oxidoreductase (luciferase family)
MYEGLSLSGLVLASTRRIRVGSIRLPFFSNPAMLARGLATLQEGSAGRALAFFGAGGAPDVTRIGLPAATAGDRVAWLEELLDALHPLLRGEAVTRDGKYVRLDRVTAPAIDPPPPVIVAGSGARTLELVDRYADVWDANVPPLRERLEPLRSRLSREVETWAWVFARPGASLDEAAAAYRRHCPWFRNLSDAELSRALLHGDPEGCRERLDELPGELGITRPIVDLTGLDAGGAAQVLEALAPAKRGSMS